MRRLSLLPVLLALVALAFAGCGGGDDDDSSSGGASSAPAETTTGGGTETSGGGGRTVMIQMKDIAFQPADSIVKVGEKVTWTNDDSVDHNVVSTEGEKIESENFGEGGTFSFTPTKAGTITYVCTLHPGMDGTLNVEE